MLLHAKKPLVAFFRLVHLWVTGAFFILGRGHRMDNRGILHGAALELQAAGFQHVIDDIHQR